MPTCRTSDSPVLFEHLVMITVIVSTVSAFCFRSVRRACLYLCGIANVDDFGLASTRRVSPISLSLLLRFRRRVSAGPQATCRRPPSTAKILFRFRKQRNHTPTLQSETFVWRSQCPQRGRRARGLHNTGCSQTYSRKLKRLNDFVLITQTRVKVNARRRITFSALTAVYTSPTLSSQAVEKSPRGRGPVRLGQVRIGLMGVSPTTDGSHFTVCKLRISLLHSGAKDIELALESRRKRRRYRSNYRFVVLA